MQLGMVLVPHLELHAISKGQVSNTTTGPRLDFESQAWANSFDPQAAVPAQMVVDIPDKWADFFSSLLLSPKRFPIVKEILSLGLWAVVSQSEEHQGRKKNLCRP